MFSNFVTLQPQAWLNWDQPEVEHKSEVKEKAYKVYRIGMYSIFSLFYLGTTQYMLYQSVLMCSSWIVHDGLHVQA